MDMTNDGAVIAAAAARAPRFVKKASVDIASAESADEPYVNFINQHHSVNLGVRQPAAFTASHV
jgi:hypothetical protein